MLRRTITAMLCYKLVDEKRDENEENSFARFFEFDNKLKRAVKMIGSEKNKFLQGFKHISLYNGNFLDISFHIRFSSYLKVLGDLFKKFNRLMEYFLNRYQPELSRVNAYIPFK